MESINVDEDWLSSTNRSGSNSSSSSKDYDRRKFRPDTRGVILRSYMTYTNADTKASLNRTLLVGNALYEEPSTPYIPPIFVLIMYETTPYARYVSVEKCTTTQNTEGLGEPKETKSPNVRNTDFVFKENKLLVREMLKSIDCLPESIQHCFLRFEHAGSLQSMFTEYFPTPALRIGCLVRIKYKSLGKRISALEFLNDNSASNSDLYAINYSSNNCTTTVTRYLEPLFRHALELQKAWCVDSDKKLDETEDNGIFNVNFHLLDIESEKQQERDDEHKEKPIFFFGSTHSSTTPRMCTPIKERSGCTSPLTTHDVSRFYRTSSFYGDRNGALQLQSLPLVYVRHERDFICLSASTEYKRSIVLFHVYYVWTREIANTLTELSITVNSSTESENSIVKMCVCDIFESRTSAYLKMLDDSKTCFWKKNMNTYVRLVMDSTREELSYSRFVLSTLVTQGITSGKVSLQSHIEGARKTSAGTIEMFPNSITLDCSKLAADLDDGVSAFAASYKQNERDAMLYANADGAAGLPTDVLASRQRRIGDMLMQFKAERIAELACNMAGEMYLGVLDLYGMGEVNNKMRYDPVSNYQFLRALVNESVFTSSTTFDTDLHTLLKNNNAEDIKLIPSPCASFQEGIHCAREEKEIVEFDIESAYPTIIETFNISPETTVIMRKTEFDRAEKRLEALMVSGDEGRFKVSRWCFVVPYSDAPEEFVIVSLMPSVYKGFTNRMFTSLVLKRRTNKNISAYFYKRLANRLVGCMGQKGSDVSALHCLSATSSLCRTVVTRTLDNLRHSVKVLRTQTDGCLVQASRKIVRLAEEIQQAFTDSIAALLAKDSIDQSAIQSLLKVRVKDVNVCFIAGQNKYAIKYANDTKVLKGHPAKYVPTTSAEANVSEAVFETIENISLAGFECSCEDVIAYLIDNIRERMLNGDGGTDDVDDFYFIERIFPLENRREEDKLLDINHFKYDQHCRFGDTIPLWPVIKIEGDRTVRGYVHRPQRVKGPVIVDRFSILKNLINAWAFDLCRSQCFDFRTDRQSEGNYVDVFYSKLLRAGNDYAVRMYNRK